MSDFLTLTDEDDGKLFRVRVLNTGEVRIARYHCFSLAGRPLNSSSRALPTRTIRTIIGADCMRAGARRLLAGFARYCPNLDAFRLREPDQHMSRTRPQRLP